MAYNDVVQSITNAVSDSISLGDILNGKPDVQIKTRLGRLVWTIATINSRVDSATIQANQKLTDLDNAINTAAAAGAGANGWDDLLIATSENTTQRQVNDGLESIAQLIAIKNPRNGQRVYAKSRNTPNYALAKPFDGGGGTFVYDSTKASVNDGGIIINGWRRLFSGFAQVEWWGAIADGVTDCTVAFQKAINYCISNPVRPHSAYRGGAIGIQLNTGVYNITGTLNLKTLHGFNIIGKGLQSTTLLCSTNNITLFAFQGYNTIKFSDFTISCGTFDNTSKFVTFFTTRQSIAFDFDGLSGGREFAQERIRVEGFYKVYQTTTGSINCDTHSHYKCQYQNNSILWDNSNVNAVCWHFIDCMAWATSVAVFRNPCNTTKVTGGNWVNACPFFQVTVGGHGNHFLAKGLRFESWNPSYTDATGIHQYVDIQKDVVNVVFEECTTFGTYYDEVTGNLQGMFDVTFKNCHLYGKFNVKADAYNLGVKAHLTFEHCSKTPTVIQDYLTTTGNCPINLTYIRHKTSASTTVNRNFVGSYYANGSQSLAIVPMIDYFKATAVVNNNATLFTYPVFVVDPYILQLARIRVMLAKNTSNTLTLNFYSDAAKTQLFATKTITTVPSTTSDVYLTFDINAADFSAVPQFTAGSNIYVEMTSTANAGAVKARFMFDYVQAS